ncbi:winged helix-turn-helix domain-containing protein [Saccharothrix sp. ST-888]|uniref:winged helix-turn-helix domain-containing protein n=1 Tax=Saccharothrix sp. ST-888 TaxID=1427391 RepID=UPI0009E1DB5E|nr:winged helix-turn-helix domain-containing protein [Saccharothrix sp. ST-888]
MSSSSTATLSVPATTPHLRAVRSVPSTAERWHSTAPQYATPAQYPTPAQRPAAPQRPAVPQHPAAAPHPAVPHPAAHTVAPQALLKALPEGAAVVAALPQSALPQGLLAQYGAQFGTTAAGQPLVGYLVLVPVESADSPLGQSIAGSQAVGQATPASAPAAAASLAGPVPGSRPAARGISVDTERRSAHVDGKLLDLTYLEFELLAHLTEHPQRVHTRDHLVSAVWGYGHVGDGRTVDVHVARLRRKLGAAYRDSIVTVRRVGYKYTPVA